jgi:hypothetical protein
MVDVMELLIIVLAGAAAIIACVVYVALRDRRSSGRRARFEPGPQEASFTEESGISQQGNWIGGAGTP